MGSFPEAYNDSSFLPLPSFGLAVIFSITHRVKARAIIGQRGSPPVMPLGYLNFKKNIFRTLRTMRKQFPVSWLTSGRFSAPKRGGVNK